MLTTSNTPGYAYHATAKSVAGFGDPRKTWRTSAHRDAGAFFVPALRVYGGCAWETLESAGFQVSRFANLRTATPKNCLATAGDGSKLGDLPYENPAYSGSVCARRCPSSDGPSRAFFGFKRRRPAQALQLPYAKSPPPRSQGGTFMTNAERLLRDAERLIAIGDEVNRTATELGRECVEGRHIDLAQTYGHIEHLYGVCEQIAALASDLIAMARRETCGKK